MACGVAKRVAEQADTEAGVQILRVRWSRGSMTHKKLMQLDAVVVGKRIVWILRLQIVGNARKPRAMSNEIEQGDFCSHRSGRDVGKEDRAKRFVESDFLLHRE